MVEQIIQQQTAEQLDYQKRLTAYQKEKSEYEAKKRVAMAVEETIRKHGYEFISGSAMRHLQSEQEKSEYRDIMMRYGGMQEKYEKRGYTFYSGGAVGIPSKPQAPSELMMTTKEGIKPVSEVYPKPTTDVFGFGKQVTPFPFTLKKPESIVSPPTGGLYYITPEEEKLYGKKTTLPYWEVESPKTPIGMSEAIDVESRYAGAVHVPFSDYGYGVSRGAFEPTFIEIKLAKEAYKATTPELRAEYESKFTEEGILKPEVYQDYLKEARKKFERTGEVGEPIPFKLFGKDYQFYPEGIIPSIKGEMAGIQLAFMKTGIGATEGLISFGTKLSVQTIDLKETERTWYGGIKGKEFTFGKTTEDIMKVPAVQPQYKITEHPLKWLGEAITTRPATTFPIGVISGMVIGGGAGYIKSIKQYGFKTGTLETAKYFTPLRIKSTLWVPDIKTEFLRGHKARSVEWQYGPEGKQAIQFTGAKSDLYKIQLEQVGYSELVGKQTIGTAITDIKGIPYAKYVGGKLTFGTLPTQQYVTLFTGVPKGKYGFKADVLTGRKGGGWTLTQTSGYKFDITKPMGEYKSKLFGFVGGERVAGFEKIGKGWGVPSKPLTYKALFGFEPTLKGYGVGFDISKPPPSKSWIKMFRGGLGKVSRTKLYAPSTITKPPVTKLLKPSVDISGISQVTRTTIKPPISSVWAGTGMYERYKPSEEIYKVDTKTKPYLGVMSSGRLGAITISPTRTKSFLGLGSLGIQKPIWKTKAKLYQPLVQPQVTKFKQKLKTKQIFKSPFITPTITTPTMADYGWGGGILPPIILPRFKEGRRYKTKRKARKPTRKTIYMPTIKAKYFKQTAFKIPKAYKIGAAGPLGGRPIIKTKKKRKKKK